jgi:adenylyltransferase/sulfurtransferase
MIKKVNKFFCRRETMRSAHDIVAQARRETREVTAHDVQKRIEEGSPPVLLDVREREEYNEGYIDGAMNLPRGFLELRVESFIGDRSAPIVVYCADGTRSALAARALQMMGYTNVSSMVGGVAAWKSVGYPIVQDKVLTSEEIQRYSRHLMLPEVGEKGQIRLLSSKVLLVGAGGLGSPSALYLAATGIGTLGIIDGDVVDVTNLQRQVLHGTRDVGRPKAKSAAETIHDINPRCNVRIYEQRLTAANIMGIIKDYDIVVDGSDNFPTRYLVNDACVLAGKPNVHGSIFRFEGQASVFVPGEGPCYRCLFPAPPPPGMVPS